MRQQRDATLNSRRWASCAASGDPNRTEERPSGDGGERDWYELASSARPIGNLTVSRRADRRTARSLVMRGVRVGGLLMTLLLVPPTGADERYAAPGFFAGSLTPASSWDGILKTRSIQAEWPHLSF